MKSIITAVLTFFAVLGADAGVIKLQIDGKRINTVGGLTFVSGNVRIVHWAATLKSDKAIYDPGCGTITLDGNVFIQEKNGNPIVGTHMVFSLKEGKLISADSAK